MHTWWSLTVSGFLFSQLREPKVETLVYISHSCYVELTLKLKGCSRSSLTSLLDVKFYGIGYFYVRLYNASCLSFGNWIIKPDFKVAVDTPLVVESLTFCVWNSDAFTHRNNPLLLRFLKLWNQVAQLYDG